MTELPHPTSRDEILARLREAMAHGPACAAETVSSGCPGLDAILPGGGFRRGTLVEWLGEPGAGAGVLALLAAIAACGRDGTLLVVDGDGTHTRHSPPSERFYPPAAVGAGLAAQQLIVVRPANAVDYTWAPPKVRERWVFWCVRHRRNTRPPGPTCVCWCILSRKRIRQPAAA